MDSSITLAKVRNLKRGASNIIKLVGDQQKPAFLDDCGVLYDWKEQLGRFVKQFSS